MPPKKKRADEEELNRSLCQSGAPVFYWEASHAWSIGKVKEDTGKVFVVEGTEYSATKVDSLETSKVADDKIWPVREDVLEEDCHDLLDLTVLHDATIQRCLYLRYMKDIVYTNIGAIVVALNPWNFKIPWYMDDYMPRYLEEGETIKENKPHSWAQAHNTFWELRRDQTNQCILISGESGAGKTEAAKIVMKYLGALSCLSGTDTEKGAAKQVAFNINQASPILEGFGNAKTVRNDNSSRFGKFMKVQFTEQGFLVGAFTVKYLLEKSRIVTASTNERVYHAFYLLVQGADAAKYNLKPAETYHTNAGSCVNIPGVDDGDDFRICCESMTNCGFSDDQKDGVWKSVAGITHLLQVHFKSIDADSCEIDPATADLVNKCSEIWETDPSVLSEELTTTTMDMGARGGIIVKKLTTVKAADGRDALVKALYDQLFGWQTETINKLTDTGGGSNWIGLLDIFGFEDFEYNSFEQICINLANETLQNHYNAYIFTKDMDECRTEGIDVTEVRCPDNQPCLNLMTAKTGIFGLLDDECSLGQGSDGAFLQKVIDTNGKNEFFDRKKLAKDSFIVRHYAASVNYTVEGWLDKNRDTLKPAMKNLMRASKNSLIASLLPEHNENEKKETVGGFFRRQLISLMDLINSTNPHWIRCVKPHPAKKPLMVHGVTMINQLESSGVLGTVKIRKAGFPIRPTFQQFYSRFKIILPTSTHPSITAEHKVISGFCLKVCAEAGIEPLKAQSGKTKMFLKNEASQHLEAVRDKILKTHMLTIKRYGYYQISLSMVAYKKQMADFRKAAETLQESCREWLGKSIALREQREQEKKERERVLAGFNERKQKKLSSMSATLEWTVPEGVQPATDEQMDLISDRWAMLRTAEPVEPSSLPTMPFHPVLTGRSEVESFCSSLVDMWFAKEGDILDEWEQNFIGSSVPILAVLSEVCHQLSMVNPGEGMTNLFLRSALTMEGVDIDRILCHAGVPAAHDAGYSARNKPLHEVLVTGNIQKWVKTLCLAVFLASPTPETTLYYPSAGTPGQGMQHWITPGVTGLQGIPLKGVAETINVSSVSQHPEARKVVVPPLSSFLAEEDGSGLVWKGCLGSSNMFLREMKDVVLQDSAHADTRLVKIRAKLLQKKLEQEAEKLRMAAEAVKHQLLYIQRDEEPIARDAMFTEFLSSLDDEIESFNYLTLLYFEAQLEWVHEGYLEHHAAVQKSENAEREMLLTYFTRGQAVVDKISTERRQDSMRDFIWGLEALLREDLFQRRKVEGKQMKAWRKLCRSVAAEKQGVAEAGKLRTAQLKKREKTLQKLQALKDDELLRIDRARDRTTPVFSTPPYQSPSLPVSELRYFTPDSTPPRLPRHPSPHEPDRTQETPKPLELDSPYTRGMVLPRR